MKVYSIKKEKYVPKWNGNQDLPVSEQITCEITFPTGGERDYYNSFASQEKKWITTWVEKYVGKIENLFDIVDDKETPLTSGVELMKSTNYELYGLASELCIAILNRSRIEDAEKKS